MSGLAWLADSSVDVTLTDPPYAKGLLGRTRSNRKSETHPGRQSAAIKAADVAIGGIDEQIPEIAAQLLRVTRRWIAVFTDVEHVHAWHDAFGIGAYVRTGIWVKPNAMPQITGDRPGQGYEAIVLAHRPGRKRWNGGGKQGVWTHNVCRGAERHGHPCPKPEALMAALVADFSNAGETICDPFAGSASTGAAALRAGRGFVGWELSPEFHAAGFARLSTVAP